MNNPTTVQLRADIAKEKQSTVLRTTAQIKKAISESTGIPTEQIQFTTPYRYTHFPEAHNQEIDDGRVKMWIVMEVGDQENDRDI